MKKDENTRLTDELRVLVESQDRAIAQLKSRLLLYENIYEDLLSKQEETNNVNEANEDRLQKGVEKKTDDTAEAIVERFESQYENIYEDLLSKQEETKTDDTAEALRERFESQKREYALFKSSFLEFQNKFESLIRNRKEESRKRIEIQRSALTIFDCVER